MSERTGIKGESTKKTILTAASELFYEQGYNATTVRQIAEKAEANTGLVKYYFGGKADVALSIYRDVRRGFEQRIGEGDCRPSTPDMFLLSSAVELYCCLESAEYGRFYYEISGEESVRTTIQDVVTKALMTYADATDHFVALACASLTAIKPAIVGYALHSGNEIPTQEYLLYYLQQQIHFLGEDAAYADRLLAIMRGYYIAVARRFTPVMVKLEGM